jgi:hypothetical protein
MGRVRTAARHGRQHRPAAMHARLRRDYYTTERYVPGATQRVAHAGQGFPTSVVWVDECYIKFKIRYGQHFADGLCPDKFGIPADIHGRDFSIAKEPQGMLCLAFQADNHPGSAV